MHLSDYLTLFTLSQESDLDPCAAMAHSSEVLRVKLRVQFALQELVMGPLPEFVDSFRHSDLPMLTFTRGAADGSFVKTVSLPSVKI